MKGQRATHNNREQTVLDRTFQISLILKGADGLLELIGGILLLLVTPQQIGSVVRLLTQHELSEDPNDLIAGALVHLSSSLTVPASIFGALYLLLHGLVKVVLVWAVLKDKLWAYPWMIAFLLLFIGYQIYRMIDAFSWGILVLTVFDLFIVWLTWHESRVYRARQEQSSDLLESPRHDGQ